MTIQTLFFAVFALSFTLLHTTAMAHKPYNELQLYQVNLKHYPEKITVQTPGVEVSIGDLHGNALKLLHFLISNDKEVITIKALMQYM